MVLTVTPAPAPAATGRSRVPRPISVLGLTRAELEQLAVQHGEPAFRGRQIFRWLHRELVTDFAAMTDLPARFRQRLAETVAIERLTPIREALSRDGFTRKVLFETVPGAGPADGVETVLMQYDPTDVSRPRQTVCVSSQVGCAIGCPFCATGLMGFRRNLDAADIVEQIRFFARQVRHRGDATSRQNRITNVVFMGMGEPFANYDAVWRAVEILNDPTGFGLGSRHMTISTSGVVPGILRLSRERLQVGLAISLHAPDDALRDQLVPINRRWPLGALLEACHTYVEATRRRITFEYALIDGVNDAPSQASDLARLLSGLLCHVNLIPLNPTDQPRYRRSRPERIRAFQARLRDAGIPATVRQERGVDINAACGQLRASAESSA